MLTKRIFRLFLVILPLLLIFGLTLSCDNDNGGPTEPTTPTLTLTKAGSGSGKVTSSPAGIDCGTTCQASFASGTVVTLTATPASGSTFAGWSGDADCSDGVLTMDSSKGCTATFNSSGGGGETTFAVTSVTASVDPPSYTGSCPGHFSFSGSITASGTGTVTYRWERSDRSVGPTESLIFGGAGTQPSTTRGWDLSANGSFWQRIHILTPNDMFSNQASFTNSCVVGVPDIAVASTVTISDTPCGRESSRYWVIVRNVGAGSLNISSANITAGGTWFSKTDDSCSGRNLAGGEPCSIGIRFSPPIPGCPAEYYGTLRIISNDPDEGTVNVNLIGRGI